MRYLRFPDRRAIGAAIVVLCCGYLAYPYVTLYRLGHAVAHGDSATVIAAVDWDSVRAGIAEDVASAMTGPREPVADDLPAFGSSFASGVATSAVDHALTPKAFAASFVTGNPARTPAPGSARLSSAFFASPTRFFAAFRTADGQKVRLRMDLIGVRWVVTRAWLPVPREG